MLFYNLVDKAGLLIKIIYKSPKPIDFVSSNFFKTNRFIGSKERKFISDSVYSAVRIWDLCEYLYKFLINKSFNFSIKNKSNKILDLSNQEIISKYIISLIIFQNDFLKINSYYPEKLLANIFTKKEILFSEFMSNFLNEEFDYDISEYKRLVKEIKEQILYLENSVMIEDISNYTSTPIWIINLLLKKYSKIEVKSILLKCLEGANVCLRVNNMMIEKEKLKLILENEYNIISDFGKLSPDCLILQSRAKVDNTEPFKMGKYEIQDEGSQIISYALNPNKNWNILDACAGAGGKTLHIATLQKNNGKITALDLQFNKLNELKIRARRSGINGIEVNSLRELDYVHKLLRNKLFDAVLIDAPCSGLGIIRRDPMRKYRLNEKTLKKINDNQLRILSTYSKFVKPGGIVVYATCSILPEENENISEKFLKNNPNFQKDNLYNQFTENDIYIKGIKNDDFDLTLLPNIHSTDGFYMARFMRMY